ncbi:RNA polymerase factor sigma-54 [Pararhodobacter sp.]|uniref:RNA polymerase factor sigma-54 n=1 Tax=Pararhodobacter sp. TaxID=2127056 RepID=UPI002FDD15AA
MALRTRLELRQSQTLALSAQMRIALSVLRMSSQELTEEIAREAARNPFLLHDPSPGAAGQSLPQELTAREASMQVSLASQLALMGLAAPVEAAAQLLVGELRDDGMLDVTLDDLAAELGLPPDLLETALAALQRCEPAGVGARDLPESLRLQLADKGLSPIEAAQTVTHLRLFVARDWPAIARLLALPRAVAEQRAELVRGLSTRPTAASGTAESPAPDTLTRADLKLERAAGGALSVTLARDMPAARLDSSLVRRAATESFAPELLARARALLAALDQRGQTLHRIGIWLLENQPGFFSDGPVALRPLTRAALAAALGLHPSTIGRAVAGKAIDVDGRLWPLSVFFSAALPAQGNEISARQVQARISALIAAEPRTRPLSDEALVQQLNAEGVDIARRTVAKYRQDLRIPSSAVRRRRAKARRQP